MTLSADRLSYSYHSGPGKGPAKAGHYDTEFALHDVSVSIKPGSLTGLLGPNGCGKTTLLKLLSGVLKPDLGSVRLGDREIGRPFELKCAEVRMPPHQHHLQHREIERRVCLLRHHGDLLRQRT